MPCFKSFVFSAATLGEYALFDAVYVASVDKIFATSGVHVVKFNATTGAVESSVRISSPVNGQARLCYHAATGLLYATIWNEPNLQYFSLTHPNRDVYPINPTTMVVGTRLNIASTTVVDDDFVNGSFFGPRWIASSGNYLYIQWADNANGYVTLRVNPSNLADRSTNAYFTDQFLWEHGALTPTEIMVPDPDYPGVSFAPIGYDLDAEWNTCDTFPLYFPVACEYVSFDGLVYATDGAGNLLRLDNPGASAYTVFDMTAVQSGADPCRLRWNVYDGQIYMPCMTNNSFILWDPNTVTGVVKTGFANPVDVIFTGTKVWAVQNSPAEPLKEIT